MSYMIDLINRIDNELNGGKINEKNKSILFIIVLIVVFLWAVSTSIAAGIFHSGRNTARAELAAIGEAKPATELQSDIDAISKRNTELEQFNRELSDELRAASAVNTELTGIIDSAAGLAESGLESVRSVRQSSSGIVGTVNEIRDNYTRLANFAITSEGNYKAIIRELSKGSELGGTDGGPAPGEQ